MSVKIPTAENLLLKIEDGFTETGPELMGDSSDHKTFTSSGERFSLCASDENGIDRRPVVRPDGIRNGCLVLPAVSGSDDALDISAGTAWIAGSSVSITTVTDLTVSRPAPGNVKTVSVIVDAAGTVSALDGTQGSEFSDERGTAGGPPFVPVGKVELATIMLESPASATLSDDKVVFKPEFSHVPEFEVLPFQAEVCFKSALELIHTGGVARNVYITFHEPQSVELDILSFTPPLVPADYDPAFGNLTEGRMKPGKIVLTLSGGQSDFSRRLEGSTRFIEFMPNSGGTRKELYFVHLKTAVTYHPGTVMAGEFTLVPVEKPEVETA